MKDGIHDNFLRIDFIEHLIGENLDESPSHSAKDFRVHFGMTLDQLDAFVHTPKKFVSQEGALQVVPSN